MFIPIARGRDSRRFIFGFQQANDYGNEAEIGQALAEVFAAGTVKREDLFIQSKLWNSNHKKEHVIVFLPLARLH